MRYTYVFYNAMRFVLFYHTVHVMELVHVQRHTVLRLGDHTTSHLGQVNTINCN